MKNAIQRSQEMMLQRTKNEAADLDIEVQIEPPGKEKMSEIIINYAQPLLSMAQDVIQEKIALSLAIALWNIAMFAEEN